MPSIQFLSRVLENDEKSIIVSIVRFIDIDNLFQTGVLNVTNKMSSENLLVLHNKKVTL